MFIVEARRNSDHEGVYPLKLVCVRQVQAGPVFEFWGKESRKKVAVFHDETDANDAGNRIVADLNERWQGLQTYTFQVTSVSHE